MFERHDWTSFRTVEGLQQKAGVPASRLRGLVLKELTDNALDTGARVRIGALPDGGYFVEDDGPGIAGEPETIAALFCIDRPLRSTKLLRLPTRGALGNGLRVVAGSVLASDGALVVATCQRRIVLRPESDGSTTVVEVAPCDAVGTRIEITFGAAIPEDADALRDATLAIGLARGAGYTGKSSPWWYDGPQFHELLLASGTTPLRELLARLDGCSGGRAGEIVAEAGLGRMACADVGRQQAVRLLAVARDNARPVNPKRLGAIGDDGSGGYALASGTKRLGSAPKAEIPFVAEAWAAERPHMHLIACVNRTPVTGDAFAVHNKREIKLYGCGLADTVTEAPKDKNFTIVLNVTAPYMPITSDGKEPDLRPFLLDGIATAVAKAVRKARQPDAKADGLSQKNVVLDHLREVIAEVSGPQGYRFNARQLFYQLRPIVMAATGKELKTANFTDIITDYEAAHGEIEGMYHEPRGSITHPHRDETITLGTLMVEAYARPVWTFNKLLYIEKEGAMEALKQDRWPERHDCAVMSSKGFSTRAARDLIDKLAEHDEPVEVFCAHDADASGTMIFQTLQEATRARGARKVQIINLGLEPWEAVAIELEVETVPPTDRRKPVADYVADHDGHWEEWLQDQRVELNAMTTPELIAWLDGKMAEFGSGKLIPPAEVLQQELEELTEAALREAITARVLAEAGLDDLVAAALAAVPPVGRTALLRRIRRRFKEQDDAEWRDEIAALARTQAGLEDE